MKQKFLESLISSQASTFAGSISKFFPMLDNTSVNRIIDGSIFNVLGHVYLAEIPQSDYSKGIASNFIYRGGFQVAKLSSSIVIKNEVSDCFPQLEGLPKEFISNLVGLELFFTINAIEGMIKNDYGKWGFILSVNAALAGSVYHKADSWNSTKWTMPKVAEGALGIVSSFLVVDLLHKYAEDSMIMNLNNYIDIPLIATAGMTVTASNAAYHAVSKLDANSSDYEKTWVGFEAGGQSIASDLIKMAAFITARVTAPIAVKVIVPYVVAAAPSVIEGFVINLVFDAVFYASFEISNGLFEITDFDMEILGQTYDVD